MSEEFKAIVAAVKAATDAESPIDFCILRGTARGHFAALAYMMRTNRITPSKEDTERLAAEYDRLYNASSFWIKATAKGANLPTAPSNPFRPANLRGMSYADVAYRAMFGYGVADEVRNPNPIEEDLE